MGTRITSLSQLTIVLSLKDRSEDTGVFLATSFYPDVKYLVLDGSQGDENQELFESRATPNVRYVRSSPDRSIDDYVLKMATGIMTIDTPYTLMVDNDDVFLRGGVTAAIESLQSEPGCIFAGGDLLGYLRSHGNSNRVSWPKTNFDPSALHLKGGLEAINQSRLDFRSIWNSVFATDSLSWCWNEILNCKVRDPYLIEFLLIDLAFSRGCYYYTGVPHYLRLQNQSDRAISTLGFKSVEQGRQPKSWWQECETSDQVLAKNLKVDSIELESQFFRAVLVAGLERPQLRPTKLLRRVVRTVSDRIHWLTIPAAIRLVTTRAYRLFPLRDPGGIA